MKLLLGLQMIAGASNHDGASMSLPSVPLRKRPGIRSHSVIVDVEDEAPVLPLTSTGPVVVDVDAEDTSVPPIGQATSNDHSRDALPATPGSSSAPSSSFAAAASTPGKVERPSEIALARKRMRDRDALLTTEERKERRRKWEAAFVERQAQMKEEARLQEEAMRLTADEVDMAAEMVMGKDLLTRKPLPDVGDVDRFPKNGFIHDWQFADYGIETLADVFRHMDAGKLKFERYASEDIKTWVGYDDFPGDTIVDEAIQAAGRSHVIDKSILRTNEAKSHKLGRVVITTWKVNHFAEDVVFLPVIMNKETNEPNEELTNALKAKYEMSRIPLDDSAEANYAFRSMWTWTQKRALDGPAGRAKVGDEILPAAPWTAAAADGPTHHDWLDVPMLLKQVRFNHDGIPDSLSFEAAETGNVEQWVLSSKDSAYNMRFH